MPSTPASIPSPAPGGPAAALTPAPPVPAADVTPTAQTPASQLDPAAVMRAFLGEDEPAAAPGDTSPGASPKPDTDDTTDSDENGESEDANQGEGDGDSAVKTPVDHLLDRLRANPDDPKLVARLRKLASEPAELKRLNAELETRLKETRVPLAQPDASIFDTSLVQRRQQAEAWEAWCEKHPDGGQTDPNNEDSWLDETQVKAYLKRSQHELLNVALDERLALQAWNKQQSAVRDKLRVEEPELFEENSETNREVKAVLPRLNPNNAEMLQDALDLLEGRRARQERESGVRKVSLNPKAAAAKAAAKPSRPAPQLGAVTTTPATRPAGAALDLPTLKKQAANGDPKAMGALIDAFAS